MIGWISRGGGTHLYRAISHRKKEGKIKSRLEHHSNNYCSKIH